MNGLILSLSRFWNTQNYNYQHVHKIMIKNLKKYNSSVHALAESLFKMSLWAMKYK